MVKNNKKKEKEIYEYGFIEVKKIVHVCKYCSMNLFNDVMNR